MREMDLKLETLVPGGQALGEVLLPDGQRRKAFVWGALPGEIVTARLLKKRAGIFEMSAEKIHEASEWRVAPRDASAYLSTSPWQILDWQFELQQKAELVKQVFAQHKIEIDLPPVQSDGVEYEYRNKMEFTWWWDKENEKLDLANYRRGTKGKIAVKGSSLASPVIDQSARKIRNLLSRSGVEARQLKTLLLRSNRAGQVVAQLYVTDPNLCLNVEQLNSLGLIGLEVIYSEPKSPASVITRRLQSFGKLTLEDEILGRNFSYPAESFFQINLPVYEQALLAIKKALLPDLPVVDFYSGVGTIGLTVAENRPVTLVEINASAVAEMQHNISKSQIKNAFAVLSPAESATDYITSDVQVILDPPRAGLHQSVVDKILETQPPRLIYLSCNPATQARDVALLQAKYRIKSVEVFNFFPKTPHIESLVVLDRA